MHNGQNDLEIDNLTYTYSGNRLLKVEDSGQSAGFNNRVNLSNEYRYDNSGNLKADDNKSISNVIYNHLNMPTEIEFTRPSGQIDKIQYTYDALGNKLKTIVQQNGSTVWTTDYSGLFQYDNNKISFFKTLKGRAVSNGSKYDYEYFLKDHQDNVRVVFASLKETLSYSATMELANAGTEAHENNATTGFRNLSNRRITVGNTNLNYTLSSDKILTPDRSAKVNANANQSVGPARLIRVLNGDIVYAEAFAKYIQPTGSTSVITSATLGLAVNAAFGIPPGDPFYNGINANAGVASGGIMSTTIQPKAYLAILFFDDAYVFQQNKSNAHGISTIANGQFEKLTRSFTADRNGWLFVYVASESNVASADVYFDDIYLLHQKATSSLQVLQTSDYYPYGLSFNEYESNRLKEVSPGIYEPTLRNRYLFQGQELQKDLGLGWYQYKYRMHDPSIGRLGGVDPLAEKYLHNSSYAFSENKVVAHVELEGLEAVQANFIALASADAAAHPNGVGAHALGIGVGVGNTLKGLVNAFSHPTQTLRGLGNLSLAALSGGDWLQTAQTDAAFGTHSTELSLESRTRSQMEQTI